MNESVVYFGIKKYVRAILEVKTVGDVELKLRQLDKRYHFLSKIIGFLYKIDDYSTKT